MPSRPSTSDSSYQREAADGGYFAALAPAKHMLLTTFKPKLRPILQEIPMLTWGFTAVAGRRSGYLLQGQRDRGADELEGLPLGAGRFGEHRDGDIGAGVPDLVAGQRGQVLQQAAEAVVGAPGGVMLI